MHRVHAGRGEEPPKTAQELLDWAKAHPKRFLYARPANSGPGRTFLQGLPYILGDKDPMDPKDGWDKTWAYLVELGKNIEYYPTGTGATMKELAEGSRDMIASHDRLGHQSAHPRRGAEGGEIGTLDGFHWVTDAQDWAIPKGVSTDKLAVLLDMTSYMLSKPAQAMTYDKGYFYPGPAVKDVPLSMAPKESQEASSSEYTRPFIRQADRRGAVGDAAAGRQAGLCLPALGPAGRRAGRQVVRMAIASRDFRELRLERHQPRFRAR